MTVELKPCHQVEILTLQDNLIDLVSRDDSEILKRARLKPRQGKDSSLLAEHGFCALVTVTVEGMARCLPKPALSKDPAGYQNRFPPFYPGSGSGSRVCPCRHYQHGQARPKHDRHQPCSRRYRRVPSSHTDL